MLWDIEENMGSGRRCAFTLIELLVAIGIIGMLIAILMPAIQGAREAARRVYCVNNVKNLGLAIHGYEEAHKHLPPARVLGPFKPLNIDNEVEHAWSVFLLPWLDQDQLHDQYRWEKDFRDPVNSTVVTTHVPVFVCPSTPTRRKDTFSSGGFQDWLTAPGDYVPIMRVHPSVIEAGYSESPLRNRGALASNYLTRTNEILDGLSYTLLLTEAAGRPQLYIDGKYTPEIRVRGSGWADARNAFSVHGSTNDGTQSPGPCAVSCTNDREIFSFHATGANVVMCDGSVHHLSQSVGMDVASRLITIQGLEAVNMNKL